MAEGPPILQFYSESSRKSRIFGHSLYDLHARMHVYQRIESKYLIMYYYSINLFKVQEFVIYCRKLK